MGNNVSKRSVVVSAAAIATFLAAYGLYQYFHKKSMVFLFEQEIERVGNVHIRHDRAMTFDKFAKVLRIICKYSKECKKLDKQSNRNLRQQFLEKRDFFNYTYAVIEGYGTEKETEQYIKNIVFDKLAINQEVFEASMEKYKDNPRYKEVLDSIDELHLINKDVDEYKVREIIRDKGKLENEVDVARYVPEELEKDCAEAMGANWKEIVKSCVVEDQLYRKYGMNIKEIDAAIRKFGQFP